jgi:UDP-N-acetylmuramoyl-tripeptide--D-alanyl-D-alanine ligase
MATPIPENLVEFTLGEIAEATGAQVRAGRLASVRGIATDSRAPLRDKLFVALEGEHFDGHDFVADAIAAGAAAVCVSRDVAVDAEVGVVRVMSTLEALSALARRQRRRWGGFLVAVAGSAGKTSTKNAIAAGLEAVAPGAIHSVRGNLNNQIGVPLVLFGLLPKHRYAVVEIGTNTPGEVEKLTQTCAPDAAVLTLIALEHAERLGDIDAIEREEGAVLAALGADGVAIANADDLRCRRQLEQSPARRKFDYGRDPAAAYRLLERHPRGVSGSELRVLRPSAAGRETIDVSCPLLGEPGALSVLAALAVADAVSEKPVATDRFAHAVGSAELGEAGRLRPIELRDGTLVLDDSYNANPASAESALSAARELAAERGARLVLVLGEMLELGVTSEAEHVALGRRATESGAALLLTVGGEARRACEAAAEQGMDARFFADARQAEVAARELVAPRDVVLVKGSRGVHTELIVQGLIRAKGRQA